jgi:hypothetical protein
VKRYLWLLAVTACNFTPPHGMGDGEGERADGGTSTRTCSVPGTELCIEFTADLDPMKIALDGSGNGHDATATNVLLTTNSPSDGKAGAFLQTTSSLTIAQTPDLDIAGDLTMEMWVRAFQPLSGVRYWLVDHSDHYFMSIGDNGQLRCGINHDKSVDSNTSVPLDNTWHHVACTFSAVSQGTLEVFIDGNVTDCKQTSLAIANMPGTTSIASKTNGNAAEHFYGDLDNVHLYAATLSPAEICNAATGSGTSCNSQCPADSSGSGSGSDWGGHW